jgi:hypothetical protein
LRDWIAICLPPDLASEKAVDGFHGRRRIAADDRSATRTKLKAETRARRRLERSVDPGRHFRHIEIDLPSAPPHDASPLSSSLYLLISSKTEKEVTDLTGSSGSPEKTRGFFRHVGSCNVPVM